MGLLHFGVANPTHNDQVASILDFHCNVLHMKWVHPEMGISS